MSNRYKRTTIAEVAKLAGVSLATASNALNDVRYVTFETKSRVELAAMKLGYMSNHKFNRSRSSGIGIIGLFTSLPSAIAGKAARMGFLREIAVTTADLALDYGYALLLVPTLGPNAPRFAELAIEAAIVIEPLQDDPYVAQLSKRGIPFVTIGKQPYGGSGASIDIRSAETARLLLDHLDGASSKCIALLVARERRNSHIETETAYQTYVAARKRESMVLFIGEEDGEEGARIATRDLLRREPRVDGILATVDAFASGALRALHELNIEVPGRVRIATRYDGHRARESAPQLTAVDLHLDDVAASALKLLISQIEKGRTRRVVLAPLPTLIPRASTV